MHKNKKKLNFQDKVIKYIKEEKKLQEEYNIKCVAVMRFKQRSVPFLSKIALAILNMQGAKIENRYTPDNN